MAISLVSENCSDQETMKLEYGKNGEGVGEERAEKNKGWTQNYKAVYLERNRIGVCCILGLLGLLTMINIGLTLWLITSLRLNVNGSGPISFLENGLQIRGSTFSLGNIVAREISGGVQDLKIVSDRNIIFEAESTLLNLKHNTEVFTEEFRIKNTEGDEVLLINRDGIKAENGKLSARSAVLTSTLQTPLVEGIAGEKLVLETLTSSLKLIGAEGISLESGGGGITIKAFSDIKIQSKQGQIRLRGPDVRMLDLPTVNTTRLSSFNSNKDIFQVCVCESGKLFLAAARSSCNVNINMC